MAALELSGTVTRNTAGVLEIVLGKTTERSNIEPIATAILNIAEDVFIDTDKIALLVGLLKLFAVDDQLPSLPPPELALYSRFLPGPVLRPYFKSAFITGISSSVIQSLLDNPHSSSQENIDGDVTHLRHLVNVIVSWFRIIPASIVDQLWNDFDLIDDEDKSYVILFCVLPVWLARNAPTIMNFKDGDYDELFRALRAVLSVAIMDHSVLADFTTLLDNLLYTKPLWSSNHLYADLPDTHSWSTTMAILLKRPIDAAVTTATLSQTQVIDVAHMLGYINIHHGCYFWLNLIVDNFATPIDYTTMTTIPYYKDKQGPPHRVYSVAPHVVEQLLPQEYKRADTPRTSPLYFIPRIDFAIVTNVLRALDTTIDPPTDLPTTILLIVNRAVAAVPSLDFLDNCELKDYIEKDKRRTLRNTATTDILSTAEALSVWLDEPDVYHKVAVTTGSDGKITSFELETRTHMLPALVFSAFIHDAFTTSILISNDRFERARTLFSTTSVSIHPVVLYAIYHALGSEATGWLERTDPISVLIIYTLYAIITHHGFSSPFNFRTTFQSINKRRPLTDLYTFSQLDELTFYRLLRGVMFLFFPTPQLLTYAAAVLSPELNRKCRGGHELNSTKMITHYHSLPTTDVVADWITTTVILKLTTNNDLLYDSDLDVVQAMVRYHIVRTPETPSHVIE